MLIYLGIFNNWLFYFDLPYRDNFVILHTHNFELSHLY